MHVKWNWKVIKQEAEEGASSGPNNPPPVPSGNMRERFLEFSASIDTLSQEKKVNP